MLNDSLAPIRRACIFFGTMAVVVATLTFGAGFQSASDQSSTAIAATNQRNNAPSDTRFAAVDPAHQVTDRSKRPIVPTREARMLGPTSSALR